MTINVRKANNATILDLTGSLITGEPVEAFRGEIRKLLAAGVTNLAINLAGVPYLDSTGIGALVSAYTSIKAAGAKCKFFAAPRGVLILLKLVNLDTVFELREDEASALSSF